MTRIDDTHDPARQSWVASANGHPDFPIQNLPLCVFAPSEGAPGPPGPGFSPGNRLAGPPRCGVAIGDAILDLDAAFRAGVFSGAAARAAAHASDSSLNRLLGSGTESRVALRARLVHVFTAGASEQTTLEPLLHAQRECTLHLPTSIGDYTDFYAGIHHATNVGRLFRPDNPLLPNYKHVPIGYHGRSSSVCVSGTPVTRPHGQCKGPDDPAPSYVSSRRLDYELELAVWIGEGNALGSPIPITEASDHVAGFGLLNDWSARDIQSWEYQPLGPFLAKSFATSVSPWLVTPEALAPFRVAHRMRTAEDPSPLPYLLDNSDQNHGGLEIELEVLLLTDCLRARGLPPHRLCLSSTRHLYWTVAQLVAHHTSNGCNLRPGDLLGTGTISAPTAEGYGSLLESTDGGRRPITLASGNTRTFLEDGDEVIMRARARREGFATVGFGEVTGRIVAAVVDPR